MKYIAFLCTAIKQVAIFCVVSACLMALLKFIGTPTTGNLVPRFSTTGVVMGFVYRVDSWWGLKHDEYEAYSVYGDANYKYQEGQQIIVVPIDAYEIE